MSLPNARLAYHDCFDLFDAAVSDPKGVRVGFSEKGEATFFRMRLHNARKIDRRNNAKIYPEGDPMHGQSIYDRLVVQIREEGDMVWVYIRQIVFNGIVENLSDVLELEAEPEPRKLPQPEPMRMIGFRRRV